MISPFGTVGDTLVFCLRNCLWMDAGRGGRMDAMMDAGVD